MKRTFALAALAGVLACEADQATAPGSPRSSSAGGDLAIEALPAFTDVIPLPYTDTVTSSLPAFEIKQKGGGIAGRFEILNPLSSNIALYGVSKGNGAALLAWNQGRGRGVQIVTTNALNTLAALDVTSQGLGRTALAAAMDVRANNPNSTFPAVQFTTLGKNSVLNLNHRGPAGSLATFQVNGTTKIRFARNGKGFFNGGTQTGGADIAEAFEVEGMVQEYEPGDVLAISNRSDRKVEKSAEPYSTHVIGVYATKPGVLLSERDIDDPASDMVPLGVVGVLPTKVSDENGPIHRGDLLVTAATPGHAMVGTNRDRMLGAILGKALEEFSGPGRGVIRVLVNVR